MNKRLAETGIRLFAVLVYAIPKSGAIRTPEEIDGPLDLRDLAQNSGGDILTSARWSFEKIALRADPDAEFSLAETMGWLHQPIVESSLLQIEIPFRITKGERMELKLTKAAARQWKGAQLTWPARLPACVGDPQAKHGVCPFFG